MLRTGVTSPKKRRAAPLIRSCVVDLVRFDLDGGRARFLLDDTARLELHPVVGDVLCCELIWTDGSIESNIEVTAVHPRGFVDVRGYAPITDDAPARVRLRRWPENR